MQICSAGAGEGEREITFDCAVEEGSSVTVNLSSNKFIATCGGRGIPSITYTLTDEVYTRTLKVDVSLATTTVYTRTTEVRNDDTVPENLVCTIVVSGV